MTNRTLEDFGRRSLDFKTPKVKEILPEYFQEDNPQLITLLEMYQQYMDSDGGINDSIRNVIKARDIDGVSENLLNYLLGETGLGLTSDQFEDPREILRLFPDFFRYKGTLFSSQMFFRALYGEEVEISYPKDSLFIVGKSNIGPESLKYIQNGELYQTLSVLIKSSQPISQWKTLYKQFVHPAGYYLGGEVLAEGIVDLGLNIMPDAIPDSDAATTTYEGTAIIAANAALDPITAFINSIDDTIPPLRINLEQQLSDIDSSITLAEIENQYSSIGSVDATHQPNFTYENAVDFSNTILRWDDNKHFDSAIVSNINWLIDSNGNWNDNYYWLDTEYWNE